MQLNVHRMTDDRVMATVLLKTSAGRQAWAKRLTPTRPLGTPGAPPAGIHPAHWVLLWVAWVLCDQDTDDLRAAVRRPRAPGGATGAHQPNG